MTLLCAMLASTRVSELGTSLHVYERPSVCKAHGASRRASNKQHLSRHKTPERLHARGVRDAARRSMNQGAADVAISQNKWDPHTYHVAAANAKYKEDWKVRF